MVRSMRPRRVIELGSGYTSLLINLACRRNALDNVDTVHERSIPIPDRTSSARHSPNRAR